MHDNPLDEAILKTDASRRTVAQCVAQCICATFAVPYPPLSGTAKDLHIINKRLAAAGRQLLDTAYWRRKAVKGETVPGEIAAALIACWAMMP